MTTVVDSLVVTLGLDPSGFTKGQKEAAQAWLKSKESFQKTGKDIEASSKNADMFLGKLQSRALGLFAIFSAGKGIKDFTNYLNTQNVAVGRSATIMDTTTGKLSAWMGIAKAIGGDANATAQSIGNLTTQLQNISITGDSGILPFVRALGISLEGANGKIVDTETALRRIGPALERVKNKDGMAAATAYGRGLGLNDDLILILTQGQGALEKYMADQRKWGTITAEQAKASQDLAYANHGLEQSFESLGRQVVQETAPGLIKFKNALTDIIVSAKDSGWIAAMFKPFNQAMSDAVDGAIAAKKRADVAFAPKEMTQARKDLLARNSAANGPAQANQQVAKDVLVEGFFKLLGKDNKFDQKRAELNATEQAKVLEKDRVKRQQDYEASAKETGKAYKEAFKPLNDLLKWITGDDGKKTGSGGASGSSFSGGGSVVARKLNAATAAQIKKDEEYFMSLGRTKEEAAGLAAQIIHESSGDANMTVMDHDANGNPAGKHAGLMSWGEPRIRNFVGYTGKPFYDANGNVIASREDQLNFANHEFYGSGQYTDQGAQLAGRLARGKSAGQTAAIMSSNGIRPADDAGNRSARAATAEELVKKLEDLDDVSKLPLPGGQNYGAGTAADWHAGTSVVRNPSASTTNTTHIDKVEVVVPPGSDGAAVGRGIKSTLETTNQAINAQTGPN